MQTSFAQRALIFIALGSMATTYAGNARVLGTFNPIKQMRILEAQREAAQSRYESSLERLMGYGGLLAMRDGDPVLSARELAQGYQLMEITRPTSRPAQEKIDIGLQVLARERFESVRRNAKSVYIENKSLD